VRHWIEKLVLADPGSSARPPVLTNWLSSWFRLPHLLSDERQNVPKFDLSILQILEQRSAVAVRE
jgi:hypothetical protein